MPPDIDRRGFLSQAVGTAFGLGLSGAGCTAIATRSSNEAAPLAPRKPPAGRELAFDFPALAVGVAEYAQGPTGCTVLYFPKGVSAAIDIRGGAPGTIWTDQLHEGDGFLHAICFAGGSLYGLEAATGVSAELFVRRGFSTAWDDIALVSGAVIFDFLPRNNAIYPDKPLAARPLPPPRVANSRSARAEQVARRPSASGCSTRTSPNPPGKARRFEPLGPPALPSSRSLIPSARSSTAGARSSAVISTHRPGGIITSPICPRLTFRRARGTPASPPSSRTRSSRPKACGSWPAKSTIHSRGQLSRSIRP